MKRRTEKKAPEIVFRHGRPVAVIQAIDEYQMLLELVEDKHDLQMLEERWRGLLKFRKLEDFLKECAAFTRGFHAYGC